MIMSHMACADDEQSAANTAQSEAFSLATRLFPRLPRSLANSSAVFLSGVPQLDLARTGLALYGAAPVPKSAIEPVVHLQARVIQVRDVSAGAAVGYGGDHVVGTEGARIATIGVGYADGWCRQMQERGAAYWNGRRLPVVGRVSMDSTTLDVSALHQGALQLGSLVDLIGPDRTLEEVAADCGTIPYEILTRIGRRYGRRYVGVNFISSGAQI